jgi:hypothetical protein
MTWPCKPQVLIAASLLLLSLTAARAEQGKVDNIKDLFERLKQCWQPPKLPEGHPGMQITVQFMYLRSGEIFGKPRITFESPEASDADRIAYRIAVMDTLQRCAPMPFTESMAASVAGYPFRFRWDDRRNLPKPTERKA